MQSSNKLISVHPSVLTFWKMLKKKKSDAKHVKSSKEKYYDSTLEFLPFDYFLLIGRAKSKIKKLRKANLQLFRELVSKDP